MKYSQGPWTADEGKVLAADGSVIARARCSESCGNKTYNEQFDEVLANADLMAAAPELLEALICVIEVMYESVSDARDYASGSMAIAAIEKATGEPYEKLRS